MQTSLLKYHDWPARALSGFAAVALSVITLGTLVLVPAILEARGMDVYFPHVDEAGPGAAVQYSD